MPTYVTMAKYGTQGRHDAAVCTVPLGQADDLARQGWHRLHQVELEVDADTPADEPQALPAPTVPEPTVPELRTLLADAGLPTDGKKAELLARAEHLL